MERLLVFGETVVTMSVRDSHFTPENVFPLDIEALEDDNFNIAFALTAYDAETEPYEDPTYGQMKAFYTTWGIHPE